jgi:hypothetical protein
MSFHEANTQMIFIITHFLINLESSLFVPVLNLNAYVIVQETNRMIGLFQHLIDD